VSRIHLDTDLGSDTDDLCALAMLLGWPDVELTGVTTTTDPGGRRAGLVRYALRLAGREDVMVQAGAEGTLGVPMVPFDFPDYWPEPAAPIPSWPGAAIDFLWASACRGATIVAIGPYANLAGLEAARPGVLASTGLVVMGGHVPPPREGLPECGARDDFNVQQDPIAARVVLERCSPLVVPLAATAEVTLRAAHLPHLRACGPLGALLADQAEAHARDNGMGELARRFPGLPPDLLNFQHDPLACAVAAGWDGARIEDIPIRLELRGGRLLMSRQEGARPMRVVTEVDAPRFEEDWLEAVQRASVPRRP